MKKVYSPEEKTRAIRIGFVLLTIIFFFTLAGFAFVVRANGHRVDDIQRSRIESCERTYEGVRTVFEQFYPKPPRTQKQMNDIQKFNKTINKLVAGCTAQTDPDKK
jgi:hypothetical protein